MITQKFDYKKLTRETVEGKRHYCTPDGNKVPSVTTILDKTKPQESVDALNNWRKRMGQQKAQEITTEAANTGTTMHSMLERHLLGESKPPGTNAVQQIAYPMAQKIITEGLVHLSEVWGTEISLYFPSIYAGTTDGAGVWKNKEAIFDFKQSNKKKQKSWIDDYFMQLCAYSLAHNELHGTNIKTGVIMICTRACEYQEFVLEGAEFESYIQKWWDRVEKYYLLKC